MDSMTFIPYGVSLTTFDRAARQFEMLLVNHSENESYQAHHKQDIMNENFNYVNLLMAIQSTSGMEIKKASMQNSFLQLECIIRRCHVFFSLDIHGKLSSIEIANEEFNWINCKSILQQSQMNDCPNDLRHAILLIGCAQESRILFQKHTLEFRKLCIVQFLPPLRVKFTYKNGMTITIQASDAYPQLLGDLIVVDISLLSLGVDQSYLEELKSNANSRGFSYLSEVYHYFDKYSDI